MLQNSRVALLITVTWGRRWSHMDINKTHICRVYACNKYCTGKKGVCKFEGSMSLQYHSRLHLKDFIFHICRHSNLCPGLELQSWAEVWIEHAKYLVKCQSKESNKIVSATEFPHHRKYLLPFIPPLLQNFTVIRINHHICSNNIRHLHIILCICTLFHAFLNLLFVFTSFFYVCPGLQEQFWCITVLVSKPADNQPFKIHDSFNSLWTCIHEENKSCSPPATCSATGKDNKFIKYLN